jgi:hypothetical protein
MLGQHPELYALPELNLFMADTLADVIAKLRIVRPQSLHGLLRAIAQIEYQAQTVATIEQAHNWLTQHGHWNSKQFFNFLAERTDARILIDKSPATGLNPLNLRRMYRTFPQARFLHLVRHPRATCHSIYQLQQKNSPNRSNANADLSPEQLWLRINRNILELTDQLPPGQSMLIQGEQLLAQPEFYLAQIADWLGVATTPTHIAAMLHPEQSPYACIGPPNALFGNDPNFLRNPHYTKRPIPAQRLEGTLEWQANRNNSFSATTIVIARRLGYH